MSSVGLWQHPDNRRWYVTWTEHGRSHRATTGTRDRREAETFRAAFVLERDKPAEARPDEVSVASLLTAYYDRHASRIPSAIQARIHVDHLIKFYGSAKVAGVNARSHERYRDMCVSQGAAPGTINRRRATLRAALRFAVKSGELTLAPHVPSETEPPPRADALTREQVAAILRRLRRASPHIALFVRLAVYTGARATAILQLEWDRVNLATGTVDFRLPNVIHAHKRRAVTAVPPRLLASLRRLHARTKSTHVISRFGKPMRTVRRAFTTAVDDLGLSWATPHTLKHTAVTWGLRVTSPWIVSGMTATSLRTLQKVYGKHMMDDLREAAAALAHSDRTRKLRARPVENSER